MRIAKLRADLFCLFFIYLNFCPIFATNAFAANVQTKELPALSPEQLAGQMMMVGLQGTQLNQQTEAHLRQIRPGAVILFQRNIGTGENLSKLTQQLQHLSSHASRTKMLIAADQEGGRVVRLQLLPRMPSPLAIGRTQDATLARDLSFRTGQALVSQGINMDLAPVLDTLKSEKQVSFIAERSFGSDSKDVSRLGTAFAEGLLLSGVIPTAKHFPGAGFSASNPHVGVVVEKNTSIEELTPFADFATLSPAAIMMSHDTYPNLDSSGLPASLSPRIISGMLRGQMHFDGVVLTDDLPMGAMKNKGRLGDLAVLALKAGADIVMVSWSPQDQLRVHARITEALRSGEISPAEAHQHLRRILNLKKYLRGPRDVASAGRSSELHIRTLEQIDSAVLAKNLDADFISLPRVSRHARWGLISSHADFGWGFERTWGSPVTKLDVHQIGRLPQVGQKQNVDYWLIESDSGRMATDILALPREWRRKILVVNSGSPGWLRENSFLGILNLYHHHDEAGRQIAARLLVRNDQ
jgi:beta-N-acetylhexosaminidase